MKSENIVCVHRLTVRGETEGDRAETPRDVEGEYDEDESVAALMEDEGKMKGMLAACSPSQTLSKDKIWANLLPLSLSFNHCRSYSLHFNHIQNPFLCLSCFLKPRVTLHLCPSALNILNILMVTTNNKTVWYVIGHMESSLCYLCHNASSIISSVESVLFGLWWCWLQISFWNS